MIKNKKIKNKDFIAFDIESSQIISELYEKYKKDFEKYVKTETINKKAKMINAILQKKENEYLMKAVKYFKEEDIEISTLMYDGCTIYIGEYDIELVIDDLNKLFMSEGIQWAIKEHNNELLEELNKLQIVEVDTYIGTEFIEVVEYILDNKLKDRLFRCGGTVYFMGENQTYSGSEVKPKLYEFISKQDYYIETEKRQEKISKIHSKINELVESIMNKCMENDRLISDICSENQYKIYFKDGYFDFKLNKFIEGKYNKTFVKINRNYNPERNEKMRKKIYNKILLPLFSVDDKKEDKDQYELMKYFLHRLGRCIAGHVEDKVWILLQGLRNSGKGLISDLLERSFESYIKTTNSRNFVFKKSSGDSAKELSWIIPLQFARIAILQEIDFEEKEKMNGHFLKKFSSGGDMIQLRQNFTNETEIKLLCTLVVCCNDTPEITPKDACEFLEEFQMKSKFVKEDFPDEKMLDTYKYYIQDPHIKEIIKDEELQNESKKGWTATDFANQAILLLKLELI
jgi:hypothetical protein